MGEGLIDHATGCVSFKLKDPPFTLGYSVTRFLQRRQNASAYKNERARKIGCNSS